MILAFDWGHTLMDERRDRHVPLADRPIHLMDRRFFDYALARCGCPATDVLFVGNQRNTDIAGGEAAGIRTILITGAAFRSDDDRACDAAPSYTIAGLEDLPALLQAIAGGEGRA